MCYSIKYKSPIGMITVTSDGLAITGLWFDGQKHFPIAIINSAADGTNIRILQEARQWLDRYFSGKGKDLGQLLVAPSGTSFQNAVWKVLLEIPYGTIVTYGQLAERMAEKRGIASMSSQAVGQAVSKNPISILIPCHRVLGARGHLTGYAGGVERKAFLLKLEGIK